MHRCIQGSTTRRLAGRGAWYALLGLLLAACATTPPKSPEQIVVERAEARWAAILAGDLEQAYRFYSPGYRSANSLEQYRTRLARQRVRWTAADFKQISCEPTVCHPVFQVDYKYRVPLPGVGVVEPTSKIEESWVMADGQWYYVPPRPS